MDTPYNNYRRHRVLQLLRLPSPIRQGLLFSTCRQVVFLSEGWPLVTEKRAQNDGRDVFRIDSNKHIQLMLLDQQVEF